MLQCAPSGRGGGGDLAQARPLGHLPRKRAGLETRGGSLRSASSVAPAGEFEVGLSALLCAQGPRQSGGMTWASRGSREGSDAGCTSQLSHFPAQVL